MYQNTQRSKYTPRLIVLDEYQPGEFTAELNGQSALDLTPQDKKELAKTLEEKAVFLAAVAELQTQLSWEAELAQLQAEQAQDLAAPVLTWWEPKRLTEAEYYDQLAEAHGFEVAA
jgi:hypothetical protein